MYPLQHLLLLALRQSRNFPAHIRFSVRDEFIRRVGPRLAISEGGWIIASLHCHHSLQRAIIASIKIDFSWKLERHRDSEVRPKMGKKQNKSNDKVGDFDVYLLAQTWNPQFCCLHPNKCSVVLTPATPRALLNRCVHRQRAPIQLAT